MRIKHSKKHMVLFSMSLTLIIGVSFFIAINLGIRYYMDQQAKIVISKSIKDMSVHRTSVTEVAYVELSNNLIEVEKGRKLLFSPAYLYLKSDRLIMNQRPKDLSVKLFEHVWNLKGNYKHGKLYKAKINHRNIFYAILYSKDMKQDMIIYVNPKPLDTITTWLNTIFLIVMLIIMVLSLIIGMRAGISLNNSEEKMKRFFSNASHELKTPLMSIQGYAEGISTGVIQDSQGAAEVILEQSERMEHLVEEILLLSRIDSGEMKLEDQPINLCEIADSMIAVNEGLLSKKQIHVEINFPEEISDIHGDEKQLFKACNSIFSNAVKYTNDEIRVSVEASKGKVRLIVSDNGPGVAKEDVPHMFERFYYGKNGSTGIGLSIAKEIVELHHGTIHYLEHDGAEFVLEFPI